MSSCLCAAFIVDQSVAQNAVPTEKTNENSTLNWTQTFSSYAKNQYVIQIPFSSENVAQLKKRRLIYRFRLLYISVDDLDITSEGFIQIGFFSNKLDAEGLKDDSSFIFPNQRVKRVSLEEHAAVIKSLAQVDGQFLGDYYVLAIGPDSTDVFDRAAKDILESAKRAYVKHEYKIAAAQYQLLVALADDVELIAWATELIGLCQEKQKKFADAIDTYEKLLLDYPESSGYDRVEQRYRGLTTAASDEMGDLRNAKAENDKRKIFTRGVFGQTYRTLSRKVNDNPLEEVSSALTTDLDFRTSVQWQEHSIKARINGYRVDDQLDAENTDTRIKRMFVDYRHDRSGTNATLGRIKNYDSGVFTSYDGASISYPVVKDVRIALNIGTPVFYSDLYDDLDYFFYSADVSWEANKQWRLNGYLVNQTLNGTVDRKAVGMRAQYFKDNLSSSLNVDYDFAFGELNNLLWTGAYAFKEKTNIAASYGQQRSPFLSATNILIGQPNLDLDFYLRTQSNEDSLLDDALERTSLNQFYSLSLNQQVTADVQLNLDYTQSNLSNIPSLIDVLGSSVVESNTDTFSYSSYGAQCIVQGFFADTDAATLGIRSSTSDNNDATQIYFNERIRAATYFFIQPKFSYTQTKVISNSADQHAFRYSLSLAYRPWRTTELNIEAGQEYINTGVDDQRFVSSYLFAGYRMNF